MVSVADEQGRLVLVGVDATYCVVDEVDTTASLNDHFLQEAIDDAHSQAKGDHLAGTIKTENFDSDDPDFDPAVTNNNNVTKNRRKKPGSSSSPAGGIDSQREKEEEGESTADKQTESRGNEKAGGSINSSASNTNLLRAALLCRPLSLREPKMSSPLSFSRLEASSSADNTLSDSQRSTVQQNISPEPLQGGESEETQGRPHGESHRSDSDTADLESDADPTNEGVKVKDKPPSPSTPSSAKSRPQPQLPPAADLLSVVEDAVEALGGEVGGGGKGKVRGKRSREKPYQCGVCSRWFGCKSHVVEHMRTHTGEKPFQCTLCDKRFSQKSNIYQHMNTHTKERPFRCSDCGKDFMYRGSLYKHKRLHTGERPYTCGLCSRRFTHASQLFEHLRTHTNERPFKCGVCGRAFAHSGTMHRHQRNHFSQLKGGAAGKKGVGEGEEVEGGKETEGVGEGEAVVKMGKGIETELVGKDFQEGGEEDINHNVESFTLPPPPPPPNPTTADQNQPTMMETDDCAGITESQGGSGLGSSVSRSQDQDALVSESLVITTECNSETEKESKKSSSESNNNDKTLVTEIRSQHMTSTSEIHSTSEVISILDRKSRLNSKEIITDSNGNTITDKVHAPEKSSPLSRELDLNSFATDAESSSSVSQPTNTSTSQLVNSSTGQLTNSSTVQLKSSSTGQPTSFSTGQLKNTSTGSTSTNQPSSSTDQPKAITLSPEPSHNTFTKLSSNKRKIRPSRKMREESEQEEEEAVTVTVSPKDSSGDSEVSTGTSGSKVKRTRIETPDRKVFACDLCGHSFCHKRSVKRHKQALHPNEGNFDVVVVVKGTGGKAPLETATLEAGGGGGGEDEGEGVDSKDGILRSGSRLDNTSLLKSLLTMTSSKINNNNNNSGHYNNNVKSRVARGEGSFIIGEAASNLQAMAKACSLAQQQQQDTQNTSDISAVVDHGNASPARTDSGTRGLCVKLEPGLAESDIPWAWDSPGGGVGGEEDDDSDASGGGSQSPSDRVRVKSEPVDSMEYA